MRVLILCVILLFSPLSLACERPITILYAPFVTLLVMDKFFGEFHQELEVLTGCEVKYRLARDFEGFVLSLFKQEANLTIVPGGYYPAMKRVGYVRVASMDKNNYRNIFVVTQKKYNYASLQDLIGHTILIASPLSSSGSFFLAELEAMNLTGKVNISDNHTYDSMVLSLLKGKVDAVVMIDEYWELLDESIKHNQLKQIMQIKSRATTEFIALKEFAYLIPKINQALKKSSIKWKAVNEPVLDSVSLKKLLEQKLNEFLAAQKP